MQSMLASLVVQLGVRDAAYKSGMSAARAEAKRTGQDFEQAADTIGGSMERAANMANRAMVAMVDSLSTASAKITGIGVALTAALTVPLSFAGKSAKDTAADFQASMNNVRAAMLSAAPDEIERLREAAQEMGPAVGRSAIEAADGIEMLAKNGLTASSILNGALTSSLRMAAANQADLSDSADLTTDIMSQFGKSASDLPMVVDRVTGALDASKLKFQDYALAAGQAGGVAGGLGYDFEEFNAVLAATIPLFTSGSDAGTSFKTFLTSLTPASKEAAELMDRLGLSFFDANGQAKSLTEIAGILRSELAGLSDRSKNDALQTIFGRDAMRTAIGLMNMGADGLERMQVSIAAINAQDKLDIVMEGDIRATERLSAAWMNLKIQFGNVLIPIFTAVKNALAAIIDTIAGAPPWFFAVAAAAGALAASIGPMLLALTTLAKIAIPLLLLRLGPVALAFGALVNPIGVLIRLLGQLAISMGAATALGVLGTRLVALAGPIGIVISLLAVLLSALGRQAKVSKDVEEAQKLANAAHEQAVEVSGRLVIASEKQRVALIAETRAKRAAAVESLKKTQANMLEARSAFVLAKAKEAALVEGSRFSGGSAAGPGAAGVMRGQGRSGVRDAAAELQGYFNVMDTQFATIDSLTGSLKTLLDNPIGAVDLPGGGDSAASTKANSRASGRNRAQDEARYLDELGRMRVAELDAHADLTDSYVARHRAAVAALEEDRAAYVRSIALDEALDGAKRQALLAAFDNAQAAQREVVEQDRINAQTTETFELARAVNDAEQEMLRAKLDMADNMSARRAGELRLLELQKQQERADLEHILATKAASSIEWQKAFDRKAALDRVYADREARVMRDTEGPMAGYLRSASMSADALRESLQGVAVDGMVMLNDALAAGAFNARGFGQAMLDMAKSSVTALLRIGYQMMVIKPLAESLFGSTGWLSGLMGGASLAGQAAGSIKAQGFTAAQWAFGGARALGGRVEPGHFYTVGERGPETFYADRAGTIAPASAGGRGPVTFDLRGAVMTPDLLRQMETIANDTSGKVVGAHQQRAARRAGRRLGSG